MNYTLLNSTVIFAKIKEIDNALLSSASIKNIVYLADKTFVPRFVYIKFITLIKHLTKI